MDPQVRKRKERELQRLLSVLDKEIRYNRIALYNPGLPLAPTQKQLEFHNAGGIPGVRFRALGAGNQQGKTFCGANEVYFHMSGEYPKWWKGYRFKKPTKWWIAGVTGTSTRDNPQRVLLGEGVNWGTGAIPRDKLVGKPVTARGGVADLIDSFQVKHVSGGVSIGWFKSYKEEREKWQGQTLDGIWFDEEPPESILNEGKARLTRTRGIYFITFTPLLGETEIVRMFYDPPKDDKEAAMRRLIIMSIDDASFYSPEERAEVLAQWPEQEARARVKGLPIIGEGLIYPVMDEEFTCPRMKLEPYYRLIAGLDVGIAHPTAVAYLAYNPDSDTVYVTDEYKREDPLIAVHATAIKMRPGNIPVAWPHDALKTEPKTGEHMSDLYRKHGVNMLPLSARYHDDRGGPQPVEPVIADILERMRTGRFKVFDDCREWLREKAHYHRQKGKPVNYMDDLMKATMYGMMMLRYARPSVETMRQTTAIDDYDPLNWEPRV